MTTRILLFVFSIIICNCNIIASTIPNKLPPAFVSLCKVKQVVWQKNIEATGTLHAIKGVVIRAEVPGKITKVYIKSGEFVKKGTRLFDIDPYILYANLQQAQSMYHLSEIDYNRGLKLYKKNVFAKATLDKLYENMKAAFAKVSSINAELDQHIIEAPFAGRLGLKKVDVGDMVKEGEALISLQHLSTLRVDFSVPEEYYGKIKPGTIVRIQPDSTSVSAITGKVYATGVVINQTNRSFDVRAFVPNKTNKLIPGMFVNVQILIGKPKKTISIPQSAIVYGSNGYFVYKNYNGVAKEISVVLGSKNNKNILIKSGLSNNDNIVCAGVNKLYSGAKIIDIKNNKR